MMGRDKQCMVVGNRLIKTKEIADFVEKKKKANPRPSMEAESSVDNGDGASEGDGEESSNSDDDSVMTTPPSSPSRSSGKMSDNEVAAKHVQPTKTSTPAETSKLVSTNQQLPKTPKPKAESKTRKTDNARVNPPATLTNTATGKGASDADKEKKSSKEKEGDSRTNRSHDQIDTHSIISGNIGVAWEIF